jgi:uncharacterized LabA/DUF88 family protein
MPKMPVKARVAVLIDADNTQLDRIKQVLKLAKHYGRLTVCCAYGDWKKPPLLASVAKMDALKIERIQVDRVAKNATDYRLLVEVGEIAGRYSGKKDVGVFVIVSGDGHFTPACKFLRERQKQVIGIGNKDHTNQNLRAACSDFFFLEDLDQELDKIDQRLSVLYSDADVEALRLGYLFTAYMDIRQPDGRANFSQLVDALHKLDRAYESHFGTKKLSTWLKHEYADKFALADNYVTLI